MFTFKNLRHTGIMLLCAIMVACGGGSSGGGSPPTPTPDSDGDGVQNSLDQCANTPAGEAVDSNGCSASQLDDDNDGVMNNVDQCPNTPAGETVDANGCSDSQLDDDGDGVTNDLDQCPNTPQGVSVGANGCPVSCDAGTDVRVEWMGMSPRVFRNNVTFTETVTFEMFAMGPGIDRRIAKYRPDEMTGGSFAFTEIDLLDDGQNGDKYAGDCVFSAQTVLADINMPASTLFIGGTTHRMNVSFELLDASDNFLPTSNSIGKNLQLIVLDASVPDVQVDQLSATVYSAPSIVNVVVPDGFDLNSMRSITTEYFRWHADVDMLVVTYYDQTVGNNNPYAQIVHNDVEGNCRSVTAPQNDQRASYGSDGDLTHIATTTIVGKEANHEATHKWSYSCDNPAGTKDSLQSHYNVVSFLDPMSNARGYLEELQNGNFLWTDPPDGSSFLHLEFSPLTRYQATGRNSGLVLNWRVIDPAVISQYSFGQEIPPSDTIEYAFGDYDTANGPVQLAGGGALPTQHSVGFIVVSREPVPVTDMTFLSLRNDFILGNDSGVGTIQAGIFELADLSSINWAFGSDPMFVNGVARLAQRRSSKVQSVFQKAASVGVWGEGLPIILMHEVPEEQDMSRVPRKDSELSEGHRHSH